MFKYQVNFRIAKGWQAGGVYPSVRLAEVAAEWFGQGDDVQTVLISQIWIPRTER